MNKMWVGFTVVLLALCGCGKPDPMMLEGSWILTERQVEVKGPTGEEKSTKLFSQNEAYTYQFQKGKLRVPQPGTVDIAMYEAPYRMDGGELLVQNGGKEIKYSINELNDEKLKLEKQIKVGELEDKEWLTFRRLSRPDQTPLPTPPSSM